MTDLSLFSWLCRRHAWYVLICAALGICGGFVHSPLWAEPPQSRTAAQDRTGTNSNITVTGQRPVTIGGAPTPGPCVAVDIAGHKAGTTDCAAAILQDAARAAQQAANADPTLGVPNARSGDTLVGIGSLTGSSQRLGADLRHRTTLPVRPVPLQPTSPLARKP